MKLIGILIVVNSIVVSAWWIMTHNTNKNSVLAWCFLAVFAGLGFILSDRITEFSMNGVGTIKTAIEQASADANAISKLKKRIEDQSATVDLIAKEAAGAKQLVDALSEKNLKAEEKLLHLDKSINEGNLAVEKLQLYNQFHSTILAAQNDNRQAYDQLWAWGNDSSFQFQKASAQAAQTIMDQHNSQIFISNVSVPWNEGVDPKKLSLSELSQGFFSVPSHIRRCILEFVWTERTDIPKKERLQFLVDVLRSDESLLVVEYAGRYFNDGTGDKFKPLAIEQHLKWWEENKGTIE